MSRSKIENVSDTALWVAVYRANESKRPDALFNDPYAALLAGDRGKRIAAAAIASRFTSWSVIIRTHIIDAYIRDLIAKGIDTIINLGAGLDTRPYRMDLPASLRWIEVDFPNMIDLKNEKLANEKPKCRLERVKLDLSNDSARRAFLSKLGTETKNALILTEGVIPYLSPEQVAALADDLHAQASFRYWIAEYFAPQVMKHLQKHRTGKQMKNAPFRFFPADWFGFFEQQGWKSGEVRYLGEESAKLGRAIPLPWWATIMRVIFPKKIPEQTKRLTAYVLLEPK